MSRIRSFALLLQRERLALIDSEHGLVIEAPPLAAQIGSKAKWVFGEDAAEQEARLHLFTSPAFPLAAYFRWFLERLYAVRKLQLTLLCADFQQPLLGSLWTELFAGLGLREPLRLRSPLHPLGTALKQGLLVYLADGVAQAGSVYKGQFGEISQAGYGFYLTRSLRQHVLARYQLQIDFETAEQAWLRLGEHARQLTLEGFDGNSQRRRQLLIAEELEPLFSEAFEPLLREVAYLHQLQPELPCQLFGPQADLSWLKQALSQRLGQKPVSVADPERILMHSIQHYLRNQS